MLPAAQFLARAVRPPARPRPEEQAVRVPSLEPRPPESEDAPAQGSISTPGFSIAAGSSSAFTARRAAANGSGR